MISQFGLSLKVINDTYCLLPNLRQGARQYYHLATVVSGNKEYVAYLYPPTNQVWIEQVVDQGGFITLCNIEDDNEFNDLKDFLYEARLLEIGSRKEVPVSLEVANMLGLTDKPKLREV